jgi:hypothetical protein
MPRDRDAKRERAPKRNGRCNSDACFSFFKRDCFLKSEKLRKLSEKQKTRNEMAFSKLNVAKKRFVGCFSFFEFEGILKAKGRIKTMPKKQKVTHDTFYFCQVKRRRSSTFSAIFWLPRPFILSIIDFPHPTATFLANMPSGIAGATSFNPFSLFHPTETATFAPLAFAEATESHSLAMSKLCAP